jgi:hypothetical protein
MSFIPMNTSGGGTNVLTTELAVNHTLNPNVQGNTDTYKEYVLTPPETGYVPVGWCISQMINANNTTSGQTIFQKYRGSWSLYFKNLSTYATYNLTGKITIAWVKAS